MSIRVYWNSGKPVSMVWMRLALWEQIIPAAGKIRWDGVAVKECAEEISPASIVLENTPHFPSILWEDRPFWILLALQSASELHLSPFGSFGLPGFPLTSQTGGVRLEVIQWWFSPWTLTSWHTHVSWSPLLQRSLAPFSCHKLKFRKSWAKTEMQRLAKAVPGVLLLCSLCCSILY